MWNFLKKRQESQQAAEQQRKIETVLEMQTQILALYDPAVRLVASRGAGGCESQL